MKELTSEALLAAVRRWVEIESPTQDAGAVNRVADLAEAQLRHLGARRWIGDPPSTPAAHRLLGCARCGRRCRCGCG